MVLGFDIDLPDLPGFPDLTKIGKRQRQQIISRNEAFLETQAGSRVADWAPKVAEFLRKYPVTPGQALNKAVVWGLSPVPPPPTLEEILAEEEAKSKEVEAEYLDALRDATAGFKTDIYSAISQHEDFPLALRRAIKAGVDVDEFVTRALADARAGEYDPTAEERPPNAVIQSLAGAIPGVDAGNVLSARIASAGVYEVTAATADGTQVGPYYVEAAADGSFAQISVVDARNRIAKEADLPEADVELQEFTGPDGNIMLLNPITGEIKDTGFSTLEWQEYKDAKARTDQLDAAAETQQTLDNRVREDELKLSQYQIKARQELDEAKFGADELHRQAQMAEDARQFDESARLRAMAQQEDARSNNIQAGFQTAQLRRDAISQMREVLSQPADYLARGFALAGQESPFGEVTQADLINSVTNEYNAYNDYLKTLGGGFTPAEYEEGPRAPEGYEPSEFQFKGGGFDADAALDAGAVASTKRDEQDARESAAAAAVIASNQATAGLNTLENQAANLGFDPKNPLTWPESARNQWANLVKAQHGQPDETPATTSPAATTSLDTTPPAGVMFSPEEQAIYNPSVDANGFQAPRRGNVAADLFDPRKQAEEQAIYNPSFNQPRLTPRQQLGPRPQDRVPVSEKPTFEEFPSDAPPFARRGGYTGFGNPVVVGDSNNGKENEELVMTFGSAPMVVLPLDERQEQIMARAAKKAPRAAIGGDFGFQDFGGPAGFGNRVGNVSAGGFGINRMLQGPVSQSDIIGMSEKYATPRVSQVAAGRRPDPMQFGFALQTPGQLAALTADEREEFRTRLAARNVSLGDVETAVARRYGRTGERRGRRRF